MARSPFQRRIQIRYVDDAKSGEKFFRFGIRTVVNLPFSVADRNGRRCFVASLIQRRRQKCPQPEELRRKPSRRQRQRYHCDVEMFL